MADEDLIIYRHSGTDEGVSRDLAARTDTDARLDLDKRADLCAVSDLATVEVDQIGVGDVHTITKLDIAANRHLLVPWRGPDEGRPYCRTTGAECSKIQEFERELELT